MKILIDIGHPAHVHMFRCYAHEMIKRGHEVLFTCRDKEFEIALLKKEDLPYISFGKKSFSLVGKILDTLKFNWEEWRVARKFKPDMFLSHGSITAAHTSFVMGKPHIAFEDTFNMEQVYLYAPFTDVILTANYEHPLQKRNVLKYKGYHELLYLHPNRFVPDTNIRKELGLKSDEHYVVMRFVSWKASHDIGHKGISLENKKKAIVELNKYAKVFISSESSLPDELSQYKLPTPPERIHHVLASASLIFGESATMVTEGAVLGIPGIYIDNTGRYYTRDIEEKYGLCFNYTESPQDQLSAIKKALSLFERGYDRNLWKEKREKLLADTIDVTDYLIWFTENYPSSQLHIDYTDGSSNIALCL